QPPTRVPSDAPLAHAVSARGEGARRARGRLRVRAVVLRLQAAPDPREVAAPAADGRRPPPHALSHSEGRLTARTLSIPDEKRKIDRRAQRVGFGDEAAGCEGRVSTVWRAVLPYEAQGVPNARSRSGYARAVPFGDGVALGAPERVAAYRR